MEIVVQGTGSRVFSPPFFRKTNLLTAEMSILSVRDRARNQNICRKFHDTVPWKQCLPMEYSQKMEMLGLAVAATVQYWVHLDKWSVHSFCSAMQRATAWFVHASSMLCSALQYSISGLKAVGPIVIVTVWSFAARYSARVNIPPCHD